MCECAVTVQWPWKGGCLVHHVCLQHPCTTRWTEVCVCVLGTHWFPLSDPLDPMGAQRLKSFRLLHTYTHIPVLVYRSAVCLFLQSTPPKMDPKGHMSASLFIPCLTSIKCPATTQTHLSVASNFLPAYWYLADEQEYCMRTNVLRGLQNTLNESNWFKITLCIQSEFVNSIKLALVPFINHW